jgi:diacylglycerol kinase family enzyme
MSAAGSGSEPSRRHGHQISWALAGERWLARLSILLIVAAVAVLVVFADLRSLVLVAIGAAGACAMLAGAYWFLANRGPLRWLAGALVVLAPAGVITAYALRNLLWVAIGAVAALLLAAITARVAMGRVRQAPGPQRPAQPSRRPFLIMNPRSGGGKVARFGLQEKAQALGAEVALLDGPEIVDVAALARRAVADGADLLGVAGGDGTQALVAGIAAEHDLPFLCISAGTRNHFAMDLGLDRDDPSTCLAGLTDGLELRIDLGRIGDRTFVNNASFGAYAEVVRSPAYRDDKRGTTLQLLPGLLRGSGNGHRLRARAGQAELDGPQALLVSNNVYETADIAGLGARAGLDAGKLGVISITVENAAQAIGLVRRGQGRGLSVLIADEVIVEAEQPEIPVGIDCVIVPSALRVVVPRNRPGAQPRRRPFRWRRFWRLAAWGSRPEP